MEARETQRGPGFFSTGVLAARDAVMREMGWDESVAMDLHLELAEKIGRAALAEGLKAMGGFAEARKWPQSSISLSHLAQEVAAPD